MITTEHKSMVHTHTHIHTHTRVTNIFIVQWNDAVRAFSCHDDCGMLQGTYQEYISIEVCVCMCLYHVGISGYITCMW